MTATAMKPWSEIPEGRERDAAVAEFVFGHALERKYAYFVEGGWWVDGDKHEPGWNTLQSVYRDEDCSLWTVVPDFTTEANDDYRVLEHVRETWKPECYHHMGVLLSGIWERRITSEGGPWIRLSLCYVVGDYSAAAYEALRLSGATGGAPGEPKT